MVLYTFTIISIPLVRVVRQLENAKNFQGGGGGAENKRGGEGVENYSEGEMRGRNRQGRGDKER